MNDLVTQSPMQLMQLAIENKSATEVMKDLMDLQDRWDAKQARIAFEEAMRDFQAACPPMKRTKELKMKNKSTGNMMHISKYAPLPEIWETIKPYLKDCDLTARFEFESTPDEIRVGSKITHIQGHSEITWLSGPSEDSGVKNKLQARASTTSYLQRYTLIGALGITTADADDDGAGSGAPVAQTMRTHNDTVRKHFGSIFFIKEALGEDNLDKAAEYAAEIDRPERSLLWIAPSSGGIFTTKERGQMSGQEWRDAMTTYEPEAVDPTADDTSGPV